MGVESVGEEVGADYCYCTQLSQEERTEKEKMEAIGRAVFHLFTLLQKETEPASIPPITVLPAPIEAAADAVLEKRVNPLVQMVETYENQINLLHKSIEQEKKQLEIQETIERLRFTDPSFLIQPSERKQEILARIARDEAEVCYMQTRLLALQDMGKSV